MKINEVVKNFDFPVTHRYRFSSSLNSRNNVFVEEKNLSISHYRALAQMQDKNLSI